ncbi:MAG: hypothetical protein ACI9G1_002739 [Pirellulaceae bacterium]
MDLQHLDLLAYIDPAIGSIIFQVVIAGLLSAGVMFRRFLVTPFRLIFGKPNGDDDTESAEVDA